MEHIKLQHFGTWSSDRTSITPQSYEFQIIQRLIKVSGSWGTVALVITGYSVNALQAHDLSQLVDISFRDILHLKSCGFRYIYDYSRQNSPIIWKYRHNFQRSWSLLPNTAPSFWSCLCVWSEESVFSSVFVEIPQNYPKISNPPLFQLS